jgi:hypothetical protein
MMIAGLLHAGAARAQRADGSGLNHLGVWKCVLYGQRKVNDERILLRFQPNGDTDFARPSGGTSRPWAPLSRWEISADRVLEFGDPRNGRQFRADLGRDTLGGTWTMRSQLGGWWCSEVDSVVTDVEVIELEHADGNDLMPPLLPEVMATPGYPLAAVRRGIEGQVVACFFVTAEGIVVAPDIVELSDEIFREATLEAVRNSRYRRWAAEDDEQRPACRSYVFRLDAITPEQ